MCGIAGAVGAVDETVKGAVRAMMDAERHRGPDDSGMYVSEVSPGVIFGFRRLSIIDLSADGHQPMRDAESGNVIVFNGEIYNFADVRRELQGLGACFRSRGDTEVLLKAYGKWGKGALPRLRGMYGFAVYDRMLREVFIARDRMGIKPVYYTEIRRPGGKVLLFASELRALLATGLVERRLDPEALASYLWNGFVVGPATMVKGVSLLPPGSSLRVKVDAPEATPEAYWSLSSRPVLPRDEAVNALEQELLTATRQHMVSDVPLGVFLSGGVDSSAIASLAVRSGAARVKTFHISFDEAKFDESAYARGVAAMLGTEHAEFVLTQDHFQEQFEDAIESLDQPTFDAINTYCISRVVRDAGLTVALAGTGGDELFGGYRTFRQLPMMLSAARLTRLVPQRAFAQGLTNVMRWTNGGHAVPAQARWGKVVDLVAGGEDIVKLYQVAYALFTREFLGELAPAEVLAQAEFGLSAARHADLRRAGNGSSPLSKVSLLELALFTGERLLRDSDAASMAVGLELRVPLLDHGVVEAALAVPDDVRFYPTGKKNILKQLAMPKVNPEIFDRPKSGFVLPIEVWAKDQLADDIESVFADGALVSGVGLSTEALGRLWRGFRAGNPGVYWSRVWAPYVLLRWCSRHGVSL